MGKKALVLLLFFAIEASAQTLVTRFVNTDCTFNGDGTGSTCAASNGAAGAYTTLANAFTDVQTDFPNIVSSNNQVDIDVRGVAVDSSQPGIASITTDATRYIRVLTSGANRNTTGQWDTSKYRLANANFFGVLRVQVANIRLEYLQIESQANGTDPNRGIRFTAGASGGRIDIVGCIIRKTGTTNTTGNHGIEWENVGANTTINVVNNIVYGFSADGIYLYGGTSNEKFVVYNNTSVNNGQSCIALFAFGTTDTLLFWNNITQNCTNNDIVITSTFDTQTTSTNITEDASSPDGATFQSKAITFVNEAGNNFNLSSSDAFAKDLGANLSADSDYAFNVDINGTSRPQGSAWDIGASEVAATGSAVIAILTANGEI